MAIADITERIIKDANTLASAMQSESDSEIENLNSKAAEAINLEDKKNQEDISDVLEQNISKIKALAVQDAKKKIGTKKASLITDVFSEVEETIVKGSDSDYAKFIASLLGDLPSGITAVIYAPENRQKITADACKSHGITVQDVIVGEFSAGLRIVSDEFEYDMTLGSILKGIREKEDVTVANILFEDN
ncbi:hypothetical protein COB55_02070 [Candidatus Wolfebacteria bacterium]|nr:MAG: hypothetical protein COB55_02070 [Candidatus Wolfebacteria bacterium]